MFSSASRRKRARPSLVSLGFSIAVAAVASYLVFYVFGSLSYIPLAVALATTLVVSHLRSRTLRSRLPEPYGKGREDHIGRGQMARMGLGLIGGGFALVVLPLVSVFFLPVILFVAYTAFPLGIALAEVVHFLWVRRLEKTTGSDVYSVTEPVEVDGRAELVKTAQLVPKDKPA
ncbi:MAG: hypothetical protein OK455_00715 [Thaumarchaeota archaeon]|nr:hypothetical protein [Nitrososphaerota archaeon]